MLNPKPAGTYRIFLFGESSAMGDPRPAFGMGRYLETLLREAYPGTEFEVVCVAMTAINSHAILPISRECARYQGDAWVIYTGHNEIPGPFGANTVFGSQAPPWRLVRAYLALEQTRLGQLLVDSFRKWRHGDAAPTSWGGLKMFLNSQIPPADPRKQRVYRNFEQNLADIIQAGVRAKVPIVLSSVACNLRDCAPFGSVHTTGLTASDVTACDEQRRAGASKAEQGQWTEALTDFQAAAAKDAQYAEVAYRLGQCYLNQTSVSEARKHFLLARDLDALPFRADSRITALIKQVGERYSGKGVTYVDAESVLLKGSTLAIPGHESFYEHVHLNFDGNYRLARAFAQAVAKDLPATIAKGRTPSWSTPERCAQELGLTDWNRFTVWEEVLRRLSEPPFTQQFDNVSQIQWAERELHQVQGRLRPSAVPEARVLYEQALKERPHDQWLHHNYAEFLQAIGDLPKATSEMEAVRDLLPHHYQAYLQIGRLLARQKKFAEARHSIEGARRLRPDRAELEIELGQIAALQGKTAEALSHYATAQKNRPDDARLYLLQASVFEAQKQREEAIKNLQTAIRLRPAYAEARYLLGMALAVEGKVPEAQQQFEEVIRLKPENASAHLHLGMLLARQEHFDQAAEQFQQTLRYDPRNAQAREFLQAIQKMTSKPASGE